MPKEHEDVETTLGQGTTPDASQQKRKWHAIDWIVGATFGLELLLIIGWSIAQVTGWNPDISSEHFAQFYFAWGLGFLSLGYIVLILWPIFKKDNDTRWFHSRILSSGIVGGSYAFLLPVVMSLPEGSVNSGGAAALRQAILLATGGLIGLIALGETRRKNDNDREAAENLRIHQQDMLNQQKKQFRKQIKKQQQQFEANAFKERKAERRERYTKAVEQLGDEKAPVRMGGVYTLVGLVDEWLEEESIRKYEDRLKEGQVIINNLCAYIRSPFTLASYYDELSQASPTPKGIYKDKEEEFYADKATLDSEADVRLGIIKEIHDRIQGSDKNTPGAWSDFEYDFSGSTFFYPIDLTNSYYAKPINFSGSTYQWADFRGSTYQGWADFRGSTYKGEANFTDSTYEDKAEFSSSTYQNEVYFSDSTYRGRADFGNSIYQDEADLRRSTYQDEADFSGSIFCSEIYFGYGTHSDSSSRFTSCAPQFYDKKKRKNTLFGSHNNDFTVDIDKGYPIDLDSKGIPLNCKFLTSEQEEYLEYKIQEIDETNNKLLEVKDPKEKAELWRKLWSLYKELRKWREEATTVKVEDVAAEDTES